jgi:hypothetical protein
LGHAAVALPLALGAFVAGLVISESEYSHQVVDEILPFRDVFNALFFVSVGMLFDVRVLIDEPLPTLGLFLGLSLLKGGVIAGVTYFLSRSRRVAFLVAASLFQIGEFAFVLARQASSLGLLAGAHEQRFLAVAVLSMVVTPFVMRLATRWADGDASAERRAGPGEHSGHGLPPVQVLIAGYGLTGQHVARVLAATSISYRIVELNSERVKVEQARGTPIVLADVNRADALLHVGLQHARVFVVAINDPGAVRHAVAHARRLAPATHVIVRTRFLRDTEELLRLGAHQVVPEEFETSVRDLRPCAARAARAARDDRRADGAHPTRGVPAPARADVGHRASCEIVGEILASGGRGHAVRRPVLAWRVRPDARGARFPPQDARARRCSRSCAAPRSTTTRARSSAWSRATCSSCAANTMRWTRRMTSSRDPSRRSGVEPCPTTVQDRAKLSPSSPCPSAVPSSRPCSSAFSPPAAGPEA